DRDRLEGVPPGHAVADRVEGHRLVLVDLAGFGQAGIEGIGRQGQRGATVLLEPLADRRLAAGDRPALILTTLLVQVDIQILEVVEPRNGGRPAALQGLDPILDAGLLIAPARRAEPRVEGVVAGQGAVPLVERPLTATEDGL